MKSIITLASVAMLNFCVNAQPVINSSNVAPNFNAELYYTEIPSGFSPGSAGPNQTWNFSSLGQGLFLGTQAAINAAASPYASQFPQANYCYTMESAFSDGTMYFYHSLTSTKFEIYSLGYAGEVGEDFTPNPRTYVTFPYTYNTTFTDIFQRTTDTAPISQTVTYDAYGTLIMPFGTFNNVVRQKVVIEGVMNYAWFNVNPFYPILQTAFEDNALGFIHDNTVLGVGSHPQATVLTYPNPVTNSLHLQLPAETVGNIAVTVSDISGKTIMSKIFASAEIEIDLESLPAGAYLVKIDTSSGTTVRKILKS